MLVACNVHSPSCAVNSPLCDGAAPPASFTNWYEPALSIVRAHWPPGTGMLQVPTNDGSTGDFRPQPEASRGSAATNSHVARSSRACLLPFLNPMTFAVVRVDGVA